MNHSKLKVKSSAVNFFARSGSFKFLPKRADTGVVSCVRLLTRIDRSFNAYPSQLMTCQGKNFPWLLVDRHLKKNNKSSYQQEVQQLRCHHESKCSVNDKKRRQAHASISQHA